MAELSHSEFSDEFEFQSCDSSMCSADEVFSQGLILASKPYSTFLGGGTRSKSLGSAFSSSRRSSSGSQRPQRSTSNNFYAHPSPTPQIVATKRRRSGSRRRSNKTSSWGLLRLGVLKAPEIELEDLRSRSQSSSSCRSRSFRCIEDERRRKVKDGDDECCHENIYRHFDGEVKQRRKTKWCFGGGVFGCKCSGEVVDTISRLMLGGRNEGALRFGKDQDFMHNNPAFQWLDRVPSQKVSSVA